MKLKSHQNAFLILKIRIFGQNHEKVKTTNGQYLTEQEKILKYVENFYKDLFYNKDNDLENVDLNELLKGCQVEKVNDHTLGKTISTLELNEDWKTIKTEQITRHGWNNVSF